MNRPQFSFAALLTLIALSGSASAQPEGVQVFGYFQSTFTHQTRLQTQFEKASEQNSFSVQQQNLFFQRDIDRHWRAFVNIEFVNSFSSARGWGSASLEEVWVRYRLGRRLNIKLGQSIPVFNNLNEIKTKTPLLPYIIRPLVYEASFSEFLAVEEYLPQQAFLQAYGYIPIERLKLDYAAYIGNGPNINDDGDGAQTGVDTTDSFLVGGRIGLRADALKIGFSAARDHAYGLIPADLIVAQPLINQQITRRRLGADFSWLWRDWSIEAEGIWVTYDDDLPDFSQDKRFVYATLGYQHTERLFLYASYWIVEEDFTRPVDLVGASTSVLGEASTTTPNIGASYQLRDSIILKTHLANVQLAAEIPSLALGQDGDFYHLSVAVSVVF
ncbi:MAG: hypothetical protein HOH74_30310 [Gemmatimonadetes bacterium]|nr:hypothetical protein [Gemmatimonadota bacterium]